MIELLKSWGIRVREEQVAIDDIYEAAMRGEVSEVFGTGTAAVISPVGALHIHGETIELNNGLIGEVSEKLYETIAGIQVGKVRDSFRWVVEV
ncbi:Branched-chain-amino-acid transaminase [Bacillus velezensis]|nr:Branched-chain-amino-acid transaminase [Bacillus velezensis]